MAAKPTMAPKANISNLGGFEAVANAQAKTTISTQSQTRPSSVMPGGFTAPSVAIVNTGKNKNATDIKDKSRNRPTVPNGNQRRLGFSGSAAPCVATVFIARLSFDSTTRQCRLQPYDAERRHLCVVKLQRLKVRKPGEVMQAGVGRLRIDEVQPVESR